jgi:hypothetical protein
MSDKDRAEKLIVMLGQRIGEQNGILLTIAASLLEAGLTVKKTGSSLGCNIFPQRWGRRRPRSSVFPSLARYSRALLIMLVNGSSLNRLPTASGY